MPALSIAENIALGDLPVRRLGPLAVVDRARMRDEARAVLAQLDFDPDPDRPVASLGFAERQLVAIAKALRRQCRVFILDEPTAALEKREIERLFAVLARMKAQGTAIIYISHRLDEVVAIADRCTVLRDGRVAAVSRRGAFSVHDLVAAMTGRAAQAAVVAPVAPGELLLQARPDGVAALIACAPARSSGSPACSAAAAAGSSARLFGVTSEPTPVAARRPRAPADAVPADAIAAGIGMVPGERSLGLVMNQSVRDNILLPNLDALVAHGLARSPRRRPHRRRADGAPRHPSAAAAAPGRRAVGRQSAEGDPGEMAGAARSPCCCSTSRRKASTSRPRRRSMR